jgi:enoyl-CoA hydratase
MTFVTTRELAGGAVLLGIDRPPANALDLELLRELGDALEAAAASPPPALVISGRPGCFSAGFDLKAAPTYGPQQRRDAVRAINRMAVAAYGARCPVVAAVTGHAIAGGLVLALCADYRIGSDEGRYGLTEVQVGVPYPQAAIAVVRAELAAPAARTLALGGRLIGAEEARSLGLLDEVTAPDRVLDRSLEVAGELAALSAETYVRTKLALRRTVIAAMPAAAAADPLLDPDAAGSAA